MDSTQIEYLRAALKSVLSQKLVKYEVVISDDSSSRAVRLLCDEFRTNGMAINYFGYRNKLGLSANLNNAVKLSKGRILKILFQDDFLAHDKVLFLNSLRLFFSIRKWLVTGTVHFDQVGQEFRNVFFPRPGNHLLSGANTISSPSVVMLRKMHYLKFAEELHYLVDCEWYVRMSHKFGRPVFRNDIDIVNRLHPFQSTHEVKNRLNDEIVMAKSMHSDYSFKKLNCICR